MSWLSLISNLVKLTIWLIDYVERQKLISEGEAKALRQLQEDTDARLKAVADARNRVGNTDADSLRDDDGHRRD